MANEPKLSTDDPSDDALNETLSACMDGHIDRHAKRFALKRLCDDDSARQRWARYHVARAVLQKEPLIQCDLSEQVKRATDKLPTPESAKPARAFLKPVAGGVIAASVAVLAVLSINQPGPGTAESSADSNPGFVSQSTPMDRVFSQPATPVGFGRTGATQDRQRLERLLLQHQQAARGAGVGNYWPVVTISPARAPSDQDQPKPASGDQ